MPKVATDTLALSLSTAVATVFQATTTFGLSKLLSVADFGAWREFVLCSTFTGILHLGLADGLQVAWLRHPGRTEPTVGFGIGALLRIHAGWVALGLLLSVFVPSWEPFPFFFTTVAIYALVWNTSTVLQFRAQCRERFMPLSAFVTLYPTVQIVSVGALVVGHATTPLNLAIATCLAIVVATALTLLDSGELRKADARPGAAVSAGRETIRIIGLGVPILALNNAAIGMMNFDKAAASLLFPTRMFAVYAFASVLVMLVYSVIAAGSRVVLPVFTRHTSRGTLGSVTVMSTNAIVLFWSVALVGYFPAALIVQRFLPKYVDALALAPSLFTAALFLALAQIVHMNACRALRVERTYLRWTWYLVALAFAAAIIVGQAVGLGALAPLSLVAAIAWTGCGAVVLGRQGIRVGDRLAVGTAIWCAVCFAGAALWLRTGVGVVTYILAAAPPWLIAANHLRQQLRQGGTAVA